LYFRTCCPLVCCWSAPLRSRCTLTQWRRSLLSKRSVSCGSFCFDMPVVLQSRHQEVLPEHGRLRDVKKLSSRVRLRWCNKERFGSQLYSRAEAISRTSSIPQSFTGRRTRGRSTTPRWPTDPNAPIAETANHVARLDRIFAMLQQDPAGRTRRARPAKASSLRVRRRGEWRCRRWDRRRMPYCL
jgi:hypothetical protein